MLVIFRPLSERTGAGKSLFNVSPRPSSPYEFSPHVHTNPFSSRAQAIDLPIDIFSIFDIVVSIFIA
jgi:hypothetical protein